MQERFNHILISLWALLLCCVTIGCQPSAEQSEMCRELISDKQFERGFALTPISPIEVQQGGGFECTSVDTLRFTPSQQPPVWQMAQWWSRHNLAGAELHDGCFSNTAKSVSLRRGVLRLECKCSEEYESHRTGSEQWVHLLIQQQIANSPLLSHVEALHLNMEVRLDYCENKMGDAFNPAIHTAHAPFYFHLRNVNPLSKDYMKMLWVGFMSFDYRYEQLQREESVHWDVGTSSYIYTIPAMSIWGDVAFQDNRWHKADVDVLPHLARALDAMHEQDKLTDSTLGDMRIEEINFGWESPGTFDSAIELRGLSLKAELNSQPQRVRLTTTMGDIVVELSDKTPQHRDNFLQLTDEGYFDSLLFHRVIENFMIQGGDPRTRHIAGSEFNADGPETGDARYWESIPAEICFPHLYHHRGALAAAREGDMVNPQRRSSRTQFYIVWGRSFDEEQLDAQQQRISQATGGSVTLTKAIREQYKEVGGTPHLDGQYTVFGRVVEGLEVVGKIQSVATDELDRPKEDVRIIKAIRER